MLTTVPDYLAKQGDWHCGPWFEAEIRLADVRLNDLPAEKAQSILQCLGIDGGYAHIEDIGDPTRRVADWRQCRSSYGYWHLDATTVVGVLILPALPHHKDHDVVVCVPPSHVAHEFGEYPWLPLEKCITEDVLRLHRLLLTHLGNLHDGVPLECVVVRDEVWPCLVKPTDRGVFVAKEIGLMIGLEGDVIEDELYCIPLSECERGQ